jgi:predicted dehydrogenase
MRFAIIGCGKIAPRHAAEAARNGKLVAVCDIIAKKADEFAKAYNANPYYSIEELLANEKQLDVVAVCTPNGLHPSHSILALRSGAHVLCEKPLSITVSEGQKMIEAAKNADRKLFVVKSTRYNPILVALKKAIEEEKPGKIYSFQMNCFWNRPETYYADSWKGKELDGGTLYTQFSHYIDALIWLMGDAKHITGYRSNSAHQDIILSEDTGVVALEMENGALGTINWSVNSYQKNMEVSLSVIAEKASIRIGGEYMNKVEYLHAEEDLDLASVLNDANQYENYKGSMSHHDLVYENLVKAIKNDEHPFTLAADGLKTVALIERIYGETPLFYSNK